MIMIRGGVLAKAWPDTLHQGVENHIGEKNIIMIVSVMVNHKDDIHH